MIELWTLLREVCRWREAGKSPKVVDKMRLIKIAASQRQVGPIDRSAGVDAAQRRLKAPDAAKAFGRQAHLGGEQIEEAPRAEADLCGDSGDGLGIGRGVQGLQRKGNRRVLGEGPRQLGQQGLFEDAKFGVWRRRGEQAFVQLSGGAAPQRIQPNMGVAQLTGGQREERESAARLEMHPHCRLLLVGVDDEGLGVRPAEQRAGKVLTAIRRLPVAHPQAVVAQVEHQFNGSGRQQPFAGVGQRGAFVEPEQVHEIGEGRLWDVTVCKHSGSAKPGYAKGSRSRGVCPG